MKGQANLEACVEEREGCEGVRVCGGRGVWVCVEGEESVRACGGREECGDE